MANLSNCASLEKNNGNITEWEVRLIVKGLLEEKIDKIEKETLSIAKEKEVSNCFICICLD